MSEAASIDKMVSDTELWESCCLPTSADCCFQMHVLDYDRALGELLELDDTVRATLKHLQDIGEAEDTLVVVTADHAHGFGRLRCLRRAKIPYRLSVD